jgi:hypothetical protein
VQRERQVGVALEDIEKRQVAILIRLLEDTVEISDGLMIMQNQAQAKRMDHERPSTSGGKSRIL